MKLLIFLILLPLVYATCSQYGNNVTACLNEKNCFWCLGGNSSAANCHVYYPCDSGVSANGVDCPNFAISKDHYTCDNIKDLYFWIGFIFNFLIGVTLAIVNCSMLRSEGNNMFILIVFIISLIVLVNILVATVIYFFTKEFIVAYVLESWPIVIAFLAVFAFAGFVIWIAIKSCVKSLNKKKVENEDIFIEITYK